jgi:predicted transposase/invertase (TIGR01784 family)
MTWQQTIDEEKDIAFEEGVRQGMEQGIYKKSVEDAKAMLADGMDVNLVAKYTGLSVETIEAELS